MFSSLSRFVIGAFILGTVVGSSPALAEALRDPTRPLNYQQAEPQAKSLQLNSILIAEGRRVAVINGQRVAERERLGNVYVLRILPNRVIVSRNGNEIELTLHKTVTRKNAS